MEGHVFQYPALEALLPKRAVTYNRSSNGVEYADAQTEAVFGVTTETVASGEDAPIQVDGIAECIADGSGSEIKPGDHLMPSSGGDGVLVLHSTTATHRYAARAIDGTTVADEPIRVQLLGSLPAEA